MNFFSLKKEKSDKESFAAQVKNIFKGELDNILKGANSNLSLCNLMKNEFVTIYYIAEY